MKTVTMDGLQVYRDKNKYCVSVAATMTNNPSITALENLKNLDVPFLNLKEVMKASGKDNKYILSYDVPGNAKTFLEVKGGHEILKLSILNEIVKDDLLNQREFFTPLIHPANIFFLDIKTIRYMYADNGELYRSKKPALEQYKALIISMFTKYSYEQMLNAANRKEILQKKGNLFLIQLEKSKTVEELQSLIESRLNKTESDYFMYRLMEDNDRKRKATMKLSIIMICAIVSVVILAMIWIGI